MKYLDTSCNTESNKFSPDVRLRFILACCTFLLSLLAELDLDYLEKRGGNTITYEGAEGGSKEEDSPADTLDRVKIIFLGAPGVGKTSIIRVRSFNDTDDALNHKSLVFRAKTRYLCF